ncbi:hypothetical protein GCM10020369_00310 [Cryptosporangium minutisporangium]|uniref:Uncharacterized protein n=1 Tax=Cryptosporangium minutisporangium TaxID=113569 RepID=A0ABP6SNN7_9ACTN
MPVGPVTAMVSLVSGVARPLVGVALGVGGLVIVDLQAQVLRAPCHRDLLRSESDSRLEIGETGTSEDAEPVVVEPGVRSPGDAASRPLADRAVPPPR